MLNYVIQIACNCVCQVLYTDFWELYLRNQLPAVTENAQYAKRESETKQ